MQLQFSHILAVGFGGMAGSILRFVIGTLFVQNVPPTWPWGTFIVNMLGCLLIGVFLGIHFKTQDNQVWKLLLTTGFCGGFTTFSAFSNEGFHLLRHHQYLLFTMYAISSIFLGLLAVAIGYYIIHTIYDHI